MLPNSIAQEDETGADTSESETTSEISEETVESTTDDSEAAERAELEQMDELVVTGSRLKRTTFESISPLQIIDADTSREAGLIDPADIIQDSTASAGAQVDLTFSGYVLDEGPGASTANLRGLSSDRTLILLNGRRMAPGGIEGAPSNPDLNLIPGSLVSAYDFLLDGASSIYGSDAIAGVVNVKLRKDFDGFELRASTDHTTAFGPSSSEMSVTWGYNGARGFFGAAATMRTDPLIRYSDAPFTRECRREYEIDQNGQTRNEDIYRLATFGVDASACVPGGTENVIWGTQPPFGTLYYTPGRSNGGWKNFSESHLTLGGQHIWWDGDGDGLNDVDQTEYWGNYKNQYRTLYNSFDQNAFMAYGEYTFEGDLNVTTFFEALYGKRVSQSETQVPQLFPTVPALNPFNPCNPFGEGVDCGLAGDALWNNPDVVEAILNVFGCDPSAGGSCDQTGGPIGPIPVGIALRVDDDRHRNRNAIGQMRWVAGITTDLPGLDGFGTLSGWSAEASITYTSSIGISKLRGIRNDRLQHAIGANSLFGIPCSADGVPLGEEVPEEVSAGCVPVNLFAPSLWTFDHDGSFATEAEENYVFGYREFDTRISQRLISLFATGGLFNLPDGTVVGGIGYENRIDTIDSIPNHISAQGLFFGYSADQGAIGDKTTKETYLEMEFPLLANRAIAKQLTLNLSGRETSDQYYGSNTTYSAKLGYRPINSILMRATKGTSYRSPNLRNSFLLQQTGFLNIFDPCVTPEDAVDPATGEYIPENDRREEIVKTNCALNGIEGTSWTNEGFSGYNVEVSSGGALDLNPETSTSTSAGLVFEQPFTTDFDFTISGTYYKISVDDTIIEPNARFIIYDCYNSASSTSPFCSRIRRNSDPNDPEINFISQGFINRDNDTVRGIDYNFLFQDTVTLFERPFEVTVEYTAHKLLERSTLFTNEDGNVDDLEWSGEWAFATWKHDLRFAVDFSDFRFTYRPRYIGQQYVDEDSLEPFDEALTGFSDTCAGPPDDVLCKDIIEAGSYLTHTVGLAYGKYNWNIIGSIGNVTNEAPPKVDGTTPWIVRNNIPLGVGYDLLGRTYFLSMLYRFGGQ